MCSPTVCVLKRQVQVSKVRVWPFLTFPRQDKGQMSPQPLKITLQKRLLSLSLAGSLKLQAHMGPWRGCIGYLWGSPTSLDWWHFGPKEGSRCRQVHYVERQVGCIECAAQGARGRQGTLQSAHCRCDVEPLHLKFRLTTLKRPEAKKKKALTRKSLACTAPLPPEVRLLKSG